MNNDSRGFLSCNKNSNNNNSNIDVSHFDLNAQFKRRIRVKPLVEVIPTVNAAAAVNKASIMMKPTNEILVSERIMPIRQLKEAPLNEAIRDYLRLTGTSELTEFDWYVWPTLFRGRNLIAMPNNMDSTHLCHSDMPHQDKTALLAESSFNSLSYLYPLLSLILDTIELSNKTNSTTESDPTSSKGYVKKSICMQAKNGPLLLIVCASCSRAQEIIKIVSKISDIALRRMSRSMSYRDSSKLKSLRCLMIQGGGLEHQYDVPLINGVDVLVCATPLILLRMLGTCKTNMERMQYLVLDEAHLLMEKYPKKITTLAECYNNLLQVNDMVPIAQFIVMSSNWSHRLRSLVDDLILDPVIITTNKLEASFLGECVHVLRDVSKTSSNESGANKLKMLGRIVQEQLCNMGNNTIVFVNSLQNITKIVEYLKKHVFIKYKLDEYLDTSLDVVTTGTSMMDVAAIEKKWQQENKKGLLLIVEHSAVSNLSEIDTGKCVVHFDFPATKKTYATRLWFMRKYFMLNVKYDPREVSQNEQDAIDAIKSVSIQPAPTPTYASVLASSNNEPQKELSKSIIKIEEELNFSYAQIEDTIAQQAASKPKAEKPVRQPLHRLTSYIFFKESNKEYLDGLHNFLTRVTAKADSTKHSMPDNFLRLCAESRLLKEEARVISIPPVFLCPYIKVFGKCMNINVNACPYRHTLTKELEAIKALRHKSDEHEEILIPSEGHIRFKVCFVIDPSHFYINLLGHIPLPGAGTESEQPKTTEYTTFLNFELDFQLYFAHTNQDDGENPRVRRVTQFKEKKLYAYKDITNSLYKRIRVLGSIKNDGKIVYEVLVRCIDYGCNISISTYELLRLPTRFRSLPPQAIEVFLCNLRPADSDLNWSVQSVLFATSKLDKNKEYIGKIQLAAGDTLWLNPVTCRKYLKALDKYVVEESVRKEFILNNYGVLYEKHLTQLTELFKKYSLPVARQYDELAHLRRTCLNLLNAFYMRTSSSQTRTLKEIARKRKVNVDDEDDDLDDIDDEDETQVLARLKDQLAFAFLPLGDKAIRREEPAQETEVYVSAVITPGRFYVQSVYSYELLERLNSQIADQVKKADDKSNGELETYKKLTEYMRDNLNMKTFEWLKSKSVPLYCLAKLNDEGFFRAEIIDCRMSETSELKWTVMFVDYGDQASVSLSDIYPLSESQMPFCSLPFQGVECSLELVIRPPKLYPDAERVWSAESGDHLWSLTHDSQNFHIKLQAQAVEVNNSSSHDALSSPLVTRRKYFVNLKRKAYPQPVNVAHQLTNRVYMMSSDGSTKRCAELTKQERQNYLNVSLSPSLFSADHEPTIRLLDNSTKQFVINMIKGSKSSDSNECVTDETYKQKKTFFLRSFISRSSVFLQSPNASQLNLLITVCRSLQFILHTSHLISLIKFLRKNFLFINAASLSSSSSSIKRNLSSFSASSFTTNGSDVDSVVTNTSAAVNESSAVGSAVNQKAATDEHIRKFCEYGGLANVFALILDRTCLPNEEEEQKNLNVVCMDLILDLVSNTTADLDSNVQTLPACVFILERDEYIKACWLLIEKSIRTGDLLQKAIDINMSLISAYLANETISFSPSVINFVYYVIKDIRTGKLTGPDAQNLADDKLVSKLQSMFKTMKSKRQRRGHLTSNNKKKNDAILDHFSGSGLNELDSKHLESSSDDDEREALDFDMEDEERRIAKEKVERYMAELANNLVEEEDLSNDNQQLELYNMQKLSNGPGQPFDTPENSSDEEVQREFMDQLTQLFMPRMNLPANVNQSGQFKQQNKSVELESSKDVNNNNNDNYLNPKLISWNQNATTLFLTITLTHVMTKIELPDLQVNYSPTFLSFRCNYSGNNAKSDQYGYEFFFYAEIDENSVVSKVAETIQIECKKKAKGIWPRLLSSLTKPCFIKSNYNNMEEDSELSQSEDEDKDAVKDDKPKKKLKSKKVADFMTNNGKIDVPNHLGFVKTELSDSSPSDSDPDSDFDEQVNDVKESRDVYWD